MPVTISGQFDSQNVANQLRTAGCQISFCGNGQMTLSSVAHAASVAEFVMNLVTRLGPKTGTVTVTDGTRTLSLNDVKPDQFPSKVRELEAMLAKLPPAPEKRQPTPDVRQVLRDFHKQR